MIDSRGGLSIAVLIFYVIGLAPAVYVCIRHGFGRHGGWLYLLTLPLVRIVGASCEIAAEQKPSVGLYTAAAICNSIGLVPLLLTLMALLKRALVPHPFQIPINQLTLYRNDGMTTKIPARFYQLTHLVVIVGLALAIAGGVESVPTNTASEISTGRTLRKAGVILLLVVFLVNAAIAVFTITRISQAWVGDKKLVYAAVACLPFLLVRVVYSICTAFATGSHIFNAQTPNVYVEAFMQIVMEWIVWSIFLAAGLTSPSSKEAPYSHGSGSQLLPRRFTNRSAPAKENGDAEMGTVPAQGGI